MSRLALVLSLLAFLSGARAQPLAPADVPPTLRPWIPWAMHGHEQQSCPLLQGSADARPCVYVGRLQIEASPRGGRFRQEVEVFARDAVPLPGDAEHWPLDVRDGPTPLAVVEHDGAPAVFLGPGAHVLTGTFGWDAVPAALGVPDPAALVELVLGGVRISHPERDEEGRLFLRRPDREAAAADRLEVQVQRKLTEGVPLVLTTRIVLDVAGKAREVVLGRALPEGFTPLQLDAPLAARVEPGARLRIQLRPGKWVFSLVARSEGAPASVSRPPPDGPWADGDETWVYEGAPAVRVVTLEGVPSVDPSQTQLPPEWRALPAFAVRTGETLRLVQQRRGDPQPDPDQLALDRQLWLDTDGRGWTFQDRLSGEMRRSWRLEMPAPSTLGRAAVQGQDQPLTRLAAGAPPGVEVRQGTLAMTADGRVEQGGGALPAVGWAHDFTRVKVMANLPPGWSLLGATGVDEVDGSWVQRWSLLDLFGVLVLALATARLFGWRLGALALVALVLSFPEAGAPRWAWLGVLVAEGLRRVLPEGRLRPWAEGLRRVAFGVLALVLVGFALDHLRERFYPALGPVAGAESPGGLAQVRRSVPGRDEAVAQATPAEREETLEELKVEAPKSAPAATPPALDRPVGRAGGAPPPPVQSYGSSASGILSPRKAAIVEIDRNAVVQTGPGIPRWTWRQVPMRWSGPVQQGQRVHLWLLSPLENVVLGLLRVGLVAVLAWLLLLRSGRVRPPPARGGAVAAAAAVLCLLMLQGTARAEEQPTDQRLIQLRDKLLQAPRCTPACASAGRALLEVDASTLRLRVELQAAALVSVPLAGGGEGWRPEQVVLDGKPAVALRQVDGVSWLVLRPGVHTVLLSGTLPRVDSVQLPLGLAPRLLAVQARGWKVDGVRDDGRPEPTLQLSRLERAGGGEALRPGALPAFARITRTLRLGLTWEVETEVERLSPAGSAVVLQVPVLPGEAVLTADLPVKDGAVSVNLPPGAPGLSWRSTLEQQPALTLTAPRTASWVEQWVLVAGPMWHVELGGIAPVHPAAPDGAHQPTWLPWPGESVTVKSSRPEGIGGGTLTLDSGKEEVRPGIRATEVSLDLTFRTSRGGQHALTLPPGIELLGVAVNGQSQPVRLESGRLLVALTPPVSRVAVRWREPRGLSLAFRPSAVDVGAPGANVDVVVTMPAQRWVLWLAGPTFGPAVLFWSVLLVTALVALALSRVPHSPLRLGAWILLGVGLTQVSVPSAALVVLWLLALGWRGTAGTRVRPWWLFDLMQLALVVTTGFALLALFEAVRRGLLGQPQMQIAGNGSVLSTLRWTQDRVPGALPQPLVFSVPLLVYRLAMLAWALWLATALLGWVRRGWYAFTTGGLWRPRPPRVSTSPAPVPKSPPAG